METHHFRPQPKKIARRIQPTSQKHEEIQEKDDEQINVIASGNANHEQQQETILLRVKRPRDADDLHEMYLEFDTHGKIQKTKFVSETDAIKNALSLFQIDDRVAKEPTFNLGQKPTNQVKLTKIAKTQTIQNQVNETNMNSEQQIKDICQQKLREARQKQRDERLKKIRNKKMLKEQDIVPEEEKNGPADDKEFKIIDLDGEGDFEDCDEYKVEYFMVQRQGNTYIDPLTNQFYDEDDFDYNSQNDNHSSDSNREDHENNEYPEGDSSDEDVYGREMDSSSNSSRRHGSDDDSESNNRRRHRDEIDEFDTHARLKNHILEKLFKKKPGNQNKINQQSYALPNFDDIKFEKKQKDENSIMRDAQNDSDDMLSD